MAMGNSRMIWAAQKTLELARATGMDKRIAMPFDDPDESVLYMHLDEMLATMEANRDTWDTGKMGRWLGWMQASVVAVCSPGKPLFPWLGTMKAINHGAGEA